MNNKLSTNNKTSNLDNDIEIFNRNLDDDGFQNCSPEQLELERKKREERRKLAKEILEKNSEHNSTHNLNNSKKELKKEFIDIACALSIICVIKYVYNELEIWHDWLNILLGIMTVACYIYLFNFYINSKNDK